MAQYPGMMPAAAPASAPPADDSGAAAGPKELMTVCIEVYDDGTFKVGIEPAEGEAPAEGAPDEATEDQGYQTFNTDVDALDAAKQLIEQGPQSPANAKSDAQKGFDSVAATEPNGPFQKGMM